MREQESDNQAAALIKGVLAKLHLVNRLIGDDGAEIIAEFLKHDKTAREVLLWSCNIGPRGAKAIAESLKHNWTVELLNIFNNTIGDESAGALIEALNYNVSIKLLHVRGIALRFQTTIKYLTRERNKILIPAAVRRASLCLIAARRNITNAGILAIFPKEIVKMIAMEVWATRKEPIWINALSESERTGELGD